jgi:hypothetical protein
MTIVSKGECWEPWRVLSETRVIPTKDGMTQRLFLGTKSSLGDDREIFQGGGHSNQCIAVAINGDVARRIVASVNAADVMKRAAAFIAERDPFGDHFSALDLARLDPNGGYIERHVPQKVEAEGTTA